MGIENVALSSQGMMSVVRGMSPASQPTLPIVPRSAPPVSAFQPRGTSARALPPAAQTLEGAVQSQRRGLDSRLTGALPLWSDPAAHRD